MTFLDTSAIIQYLRGDDSVRAYIEGREPWLTSTMCVFEVINGRLGSGDTDIVGVRQDFAGVQALDLNESVAIEAARLQDELIDDGDRLATADLLIAATARSTGDELVVADGDFETDALEAVMQVTNLRT
ncbi:PIN domain-containing protein [Halosimplex pelagicum]|uniref:Ribonuclease VapC n=1 Tax=Halosimplex pelagicum TaxID=869886 RepID=A0A7D5P4B1_9EURY|nr:PIN domain-containing protein [Halosimplex pelagicum]QLH80546.1 PIN domain-containing protein [Halosimplex pelagicum]